MRHLPAVDRFKRYERYSDMKVVGVTGVGSLWALEWLKQTCAA